MKNKKFYFVIILVFSLSALLLGFSYSKESGTNNDALLISDNSSYYRIVYSEGNVLKTESMPSTLVSIINKSDSDVTYMVYLNNKSDEDIYFSVDGAGEEKYNGGSILNVKLSKFGTEGDQVTFEVTVRSDEGDVRVPIEIVASGKKYISSYIKNSTQTYKKNDGSYYFYGKNVNNYIKYKNKSYQIVGLFNNKVELLSLDSLIGPFSENDTYLSAKEYLNTFNNYEVNEDNASNYDTWIDIPGSFWLSDVDEEDNACIVDNSGNVTTSKKTFNNYRRIVVEIDSNTPVIKGSGSITDPYEV